MLVLFESNTLDLTFPLLIFIQILSLVFRVLNVHSEDDSGVFKIVSFFFLCMTSDASVCLMCSQHNDMWKMDFF